MPNAYRPHPAERWFRQAIAHLHRLVDHQDDDCAFDHHGFCQPDATGRVQAYLAAYEDECALRRHVPAHGYLSAMRTQDHGSQGLAAADLHAVLRELADAKRLADRYFADVETSVQLVDQAVAERDRARAELDDAKAKLAKAQKRFADDVRLVFDDRELLRAEVERLKARNDAAEEALDIEVNGRLEAEAEVERLTRELGEARDGDEAVSHEWATRTPDGTRTSWDYEWKAFRFARHHPSLKVDFREIRHFVGRWKAAPDAAEPPTRGQETAQEAAGDDPGGSVGNDARDGAGDGAGDAQGGSQDVLTPDAWCERYDLEVLEPSGWRGADALPYSTPITLPEFWRRFWKSAVLQHSPEHFDHIIADAKAAREASET